MNDNELKVMYGDDKANAYIKFHKRLSDIKTKYSVFLKENKLEFENLYGLDFNIYSVNFYIKNQDVLNSPLAIDLNSAFSDCFSKLLKKG